MISIKNLTKSFGNLSIFKDVNLSVDAGQALAVIGPSGTGKSTLLRILLGLIAPDNGMIQIDSENVTQFSEEQWLEVRRKMGMIFQSAALFDSMTVFENVAFGLRERGHLAEKEIARIVKEKLHLVDLHGVEAVMPSELSGGMQKRVSIARALAFDPKIILYDEPTTGLDPITSVTIENLMLKLRRELKVTSVIVTHVLQTVNRVAERVVMLHNFNFIEIGTVAQMCQSKDPVVKNFITGGI